MYPTDEDAWREFVARYAPLIYRWAAKHGLRTKVDREDVTAGVLLKLVRVLPQFQYDPSRSFRAYLKTITGRALSRYLRARERAGQGSGSDPVIELLDGQAAREDLAERIEREYDLELFQQACRLVQCACGCKPGRRIG
jgi:RNA polymerase sigma-70 factor (ECF subfamily)